MIPSVTARHHLTRPLELLQISLDGSSVKERFHGYLREWVSVLTVRNILRYLSEIRVAGVHGNQFTVQFSIKNIKGDIKLEETSSNFTKLYQKLKLQFDIIHRYHFVILFCREIFIKLTGDGNIFLIKGLQFTVA